jgi:hypothetical protein
MPRIPGKLSGSWQGVFVAKFHPLPSAYRLQNEQGDTGCDE